MKSMFASWGRILDAVHAAMMVLGVVTLVAVCGVIVVNVALRAAGGSGIRGNIEIVEVLIAIAAFLVIGATQRERQHVSITALTAAASTKVQDRVTRIGIAIALFYAAFAAWECLSIAITSFSRGEARWGIVSVPVWPARFVVAIGYAVLALELMRQLLTRSDAEPRQ